MRGGCSRCYQGEGVSRSREGLVAKGMRTLGASLAGRKWWCCKGHFARREGMRLESC